MNSYKPPIKQKLSFAQEYRLLKKVMPAIFAFEFKISSLWKFALAPVMILLLVVLPAFAYASPSVNKEHWLFPVKKAMESIEYEIAAEEKKVEKLEKFAERRLDEVEQMVSQEEYKPETVVSTMAEVQNLNKAIKSQSRSQELEIKAESRRAEKLQGIARQVGPAAQEEVVESVATAMEEVKPIEERQPKRFNFSLPFDNVSEIASPTLPRFDDREVGEDAQDRPVRNISPAKTEEEGERPNFERYKQEIDSFFGELKERTGDENTSKLQEKINDKFEQAETKIKEGNNAAAAGLLKATEAIGNNAEHFLRIKNEMLQGIEDRFDDGAKNDNNKDKNKNPQKRGQGFGR